MDIILGIILIVLSVFLIIAVLLQSSRSHGLSGTIAGGAETFFGKNKASTMDNILAKVTTVVAIIFVIVVVVAYIAQGDLAKATDVTPTDTTAAADTAAPEDSESVADTTEVPADTTEAPADTTEAAGN